MESKKKKHDVKFWSEHIRQWETSGLSRRRYCTRENIPYWTFLYRLRRHTTKSENDLIELPRRIVIRRNEISPPLEIILPGEIRIRVSRGFDSELLRDVVRELGVRL